MAEKNRKSSYGPGFLVTAAFIGPGTVTACSMAGAQFGYSLIYTLIFATITTIITWMDVNEIPPDLRWYILMHRINIIEQELTLELHFHALMEVRMS